MGMQMRRMYYGFVRTQHKGSRLDLLAKQEELASIIEVTVRWLTSLGTNDLITQAKQKVNAQISALAKYTVFD